MMAVPPGFRDNDFDEEAYQRLLRITLDAKRRGGPSPKHLAAIALLNLHLGNLEAARDAADDLALTHPEEARAIIEEAAKLERDGIRKGR
jgi:hypothetical protein